MAKRAPRINHHRPLKKRKGDRLRFASRIALAAMVLVFLTLVSIQFARIVNENMAMASSLSGVQRDIASLKRQKRAEARQIRRLLDPQGAIPEIHDRLHLVRPNEAIIYLKPARQ